MPGAAVSPAEARDVGLLMRLMSSQQWLPAEYRPKVELASRALLYLAARLEEYEAREIRDGSIAVRGLGLDEYSGEVRYGSSSVRLTPLETSTLAKLMHCAGRALPYRALLLATTGHPSGISRESLKSHVSRLRSKLATIGVSRAAIVSWREVGYRLSPAELEDKP